MLKLLRLLLLVVCVNLFAFGNAAGGYGSQYLSMTTEELAALSDDELYEALIFRTEEAVWHFDDVQTGFRALNESQKVFYAVSNLEMEVNNGGLCQFFANSSQVCAPFVLQALERIGAEEHQKLLDDFVTKYGIDLNDLSSFETDSVEEFLELYERYPFDEYDYAFYALEPLQQPLVAFARAHLADF